MERAGRVFAPSPVHHAIALHGPSAVVCGPTPIGSDQLSRFTHRRSNTPSLQSSLRAACGPPVALRATLYESAFGEAEFLVPIVRSGVALSFIPVIHRIGSTTNGESIGF